MELENSTKLSPEVLRYLGFSTEGFRKNLYDREDFTLQETLDGYYLVNDYLQRVTKQPITQFSELKTLYFFLSGHSLSY